MNNDFDDFADQLINQHQNQQPGGGRGNNNGNRYQGIGGGGNNNNRRAAGVVNAPLLNTAPRRTVAFEPPANTTIAHGGGTATAPAARRPLTFIGAWSPSGTKAGATIAHVSALCALVRVATVQLGVANFTAIPSIVRAVMPPPFSGAFSLMSTPLSYHHQYHRNTPPTPTTSIDDLSMVLVYVVLVWRCFGSLERRWGSSRFWAYLLGLHITSIMAAGLNSAVTGASFSNSLVGAMWAVPLVGVVASGVRAVFPSLFGMGPRRQQQPTTTGGNNNKPVSPATPIFTPQRIQQLVPAAAAGVLLTFNLPLVSMVLFTGGGVAAAQWLSPNGVALMAMRRRQTATTGGLLRSIQALLYVRLAQRTLAPFLRRVLHNLPTPSHPTQALPTTPVRVSTVTCIQELGYSSQGTVMTEEEEMLYAAQRSGLAIIRPNGGPQGGVGGPPAPQAPPQPPRRSRSPQRQGAAAQAQPTANINPTRGAAAAASEEGQDGGEGLTPGQQSAINSVLAIGLPDVTEESARNALFVSGWSVDAAVMLLLDNPGGI